MLLFATNGLLAQQRDSSIIVDFDITVNGVKKQIPEYYFEFGCKSFDINHACKVNTINLSCQLMYCKEYEFKFVYKNNKPIYINLSTDTITKRKIKIPVRFNESTIHKEIQRRNS